MQRQRFLVAFGFAAVLAMPRCLAAPRTFSGTGTSSATGSSLSAEAAFELLATGDLQVTLRNEARADILHNPDVLTAVFFDVKPSGGNSSILTKKSAAIAPGSTVLLPPAAYPTGTGPGGSVGGEWGFKQQTGGLASGQGLSQQYGISAVGFDVFGPDDRFDTSQNLDGQTGLQGLNYGITSLGDIATTGSGQVGPGGVPLVKNGVIFTLSGLPTLFTLSDINNVRFQYGTGLDEPYVIGNETPEPGTMCLLGLGVAPLLARRLRRRRRTA